MVALTGTRNRSPTLGWFSGTFLSVQGKSPVMSTWGSSYPPKWLNVPLPLPPPDVRPKLWKESDSWALQGGNSLAWNASPTGPQFG